MIGIAQRLFIDRHGKTPWKQSREKKITFEWPLLEQMLEAKYLGYSDYALADNILRKLDTGQESLAALICHLSQASRQGHLCITIHKTSITPSVQDIWIATESTLFKIPDDIELKLTELILQGARTVHSLLISSDCPVTPIYKNNNNYYLQRYWLLESAVISPLGSLSVRCISHFPLESKQVDSIVIPLLTEKKLLPEQAQAVQHGCLFPFTIITGGPGTGKTHTAGMLLKTIWESISVEERSLCRFILAAPTGKAAANLEMSIQKAMKDIEGFPPLKGQTLHGLLYQKETVLNADVVLIDESSMIDVRLMGKLFASIKPGSRLIMLGDRHQLPPVETGSIFTDLIDYLQSSEADTGCVVELKTCLRTETRVIIDFAAAINQGDDSAIFHTLASRQSEHSSRFSFVELNDLINSKNVQTHLIAHAKNYFPCFVGDIENPLEVLNAFNHFRILTPLRKGPLGSEQLNQLLFDAFASKASSAHSYVVPIMVARNHHQLGLFNGEIGLLVKYKDSRQDYALFGSRKIPALLLPPHEYAYCLSIHKSQGSEFNHVLMLLPEGSEIFGREALYTGVTRARHTLEVWSTQEILKTMISRTSRRHSGVCDRLKKRIL